MESAKLERPEQLLSIYDRSKVKAKMVMEAKVVAANDKNQYQMNSYIKFQLLSSQSLILNE